jgi:enoyl-CoA hydratase/carnithine racemase
MDIFLNAHGHAAEIVLNRPLKKNAMTVEMWRRIPELADQALAHPGLRLLILRGAGAAFSGGADIAEFPHLYTTRDAAMENQKTIQAAMRAIENFPLPTLAAIEGSCYGGGCGLALTCDIRMAAESAKFAITPAKLGLVYGVDDTRRLANAVGVARAKDILFTGRTLDAHEALRIGLIDQTVQDGALDDAIRTLMERLSAASAHSARATKDILRRLEQGQRHDSDETRAMFGDAFAGADFQEGFRAFMERRPPKFT